MMHKRYLLWLTLFFCLTLLPAIGLNLLLLKNESIEKMSFAASEWQQKTHGITFTPTLGNNGLFKTLRLVDRLPDIDTVILGASTAMTMDSNMLPPGWRLYNFTQSGSPLRNSIAQAEYLLGHEPQVKHYLIAMDWAIDFIYEPEPIPQFAPSSIIEDGHRSEETGRHTFAANVKEAVSYPRMAKLWQVLRTMAHSPAPVTTFREYFLQLGSNEYTCSDGKSRGMDFGIYNRGTCNGFRYDGSATFSDYTRAGDAARRLIVDAMASNSMYSHSLEHSNGIPNQMLLDHLVRINDELVARGEQLILFMPPLIPGMEQAFMENPRLSPPLERTKQILNAWASEHHILLADFSRSGKIGCTTDEFLDLHHATHTCYQKIWADFWKRHPGLASPAKH